MSGRTLGVVLATVSLWVGAACEPESNPRGPFVPDSLPTGGARFVVVGDLGTGGEDQRKLAAVMCRLHDAEPFDFVVTTGDNVYPSGSSEDFQSHFKDPYGCLTERGVRWHASLGNHDVETAGGILEIDDPAFGMTGRYYAWRLGPVRFTMLDSNTLEPAQLDWLDARLERARAAPWSVVVFHHPVFSGGAKHGNSPGFDALLGDRFARSGVDLVLNGHEHLYSRAAADGVTYVVTGGGGAGLYPCSGEPPPQVRLCEEAHHFVEIEAAPHAMTATAITIDGGMLERVPIASNP